MTFEEFLELVQVERRGQYRASVLCPAHEDRTASLSVRDGEDKVLLYCHAGCSLESITEALGINVRDLFYEEAENWSSAVSVAYVYTDAEGNFLYEKLRYAEPKRFAIRKEWGEWGLGDQEPVLYNLPAILDAHEVWIVEGEKDVETLRELGLIATTSGGVNSWTPQFPKYFLDVRVFICCDQDEPGQRFAREIYDSLEWIARERMIVKLPFGKDITEFVEGGGSLNDLDGAYA